jgi:RHS repeat-associated protein
MHHNYTYQAFGTLENTTGGIENKYLFAGEKFDESLDDYYLRQRYYDIRTGRFERRDSFDGGLTDPISLHRYSYAHANPVNNTDPTGYFSMSDLTSALKVMEILDNINSALTFAQDPSLGNFIALLVGAIGFPPGFDKGFKAVFGKGSKMVENGIESVIKGLKGSESLATVAMEARGLKTLLPDNGVKNLLKALGRTGKSIDNVALNPATGRLVLNETKESLGESQLREIFEGGTDKFTNTLEALEDMYRQGDAPFPGAEEFVISTTRLRTHQMGAWSVGADGFLMRNGGAVLIRGLPVKVHVL